MPSELSHLALGVERLDVKAYIALPWRSLPQFCPFQPSLARLPNDPRVRRQFIRRFHAQAQRSLSSPAGKKAARVGLNFEVINASASGGTTGGGLERLPAHLKQRTDIFILELGINDAFRGVSTDQI